MRPSPIEKLNGPMPARLQLARWLGHQEWIPKGQDFVLRLLCPPDAPPDLGFEVDFYGMRYAGNLKSFLDWIVFFYGVHAKAELEIMAHAAHCLRAAGRRVVYVDVGTNAGHHLLFMSAQADQAYGFEPWQPVLESARAKLTLNNVTNTQVFPIALGEVNERQRFYPPATPNEGTGSFLEAWPGGNDHQGAPVFLEMRNGDEFFKSANITNVGIFKIDVEGSDASVCRGLAETIRRDRPFILMELSAQGARDFGSEQNLKSCLYDGAQLFRLDSRRHRKTRLEPYSFEEALTELFVVPPEYRDQMLALVAAQSG
jgi:FkbM family methyltransferase